MNEALQSVFILPDARGTKMPGKSFLLSALLIGALLNLSCTKQDTEMSAITSETSTDLDILCAEFASTKMEGVEISNAEAVKDREELPPFCAIRGVIDPDIEFESRFPLAGWNGKFYQSGCGGYCGRVLPDKKGYSNTINKALARGYATITTDAGHTAGNGDASWARDNPLAVEVYAHKSIPLAYQAGTLMVEAFYGKPAELQYFSGCSNGGRMAAMAAQRYPELFDGILGGGAVLNLSKNGGIYGSWVVQSNTGPDGQRILDRANFAHKLPLLERAVIDQCDASDGDRDGIISLPRNCRVDIAALPACADESGDACFTPAELGVLAKWYQGPRDSSGKQLYPGMPAGSERFWLVWFLDGENRVAPGNSLGGDYAMYLGFEEDVPEDYTALDFDFDRDPTRLEANGRMLDALDPDLSVFRDAGGKYLMWHGWQDPLVLPDQSVEYYQNVQDQMGGRAAVDDFFRLFMIPGQGHCWEMPAAVPDRFDPIAMLEDWVENGTAPNRLSATALDPETAVVPAAVVCPFPQMPVYLNDTEDSAAVDCAPEPSPEAH
jgi:feruloyl esterase